MDWKRSVSGHFVPPRATERLENLTEPASDFDSTFDSGVEFHKSQRSAASENRGRAPRRHGRESKFELFQIPFPFFKRLRRLTVIGRHIQFKQVTSERRT